METLMYNAGSFLGVTLRQYGKDPGLPTAPVALLVSGVNTLPF